MVEVQPFPFANVDELKARWPDFPVGGEAYAETLLEDASQFILDVCPSAADASFSTRRRVVCAVVRRAMPTADDAGYETIQQSAGPFSQTVKPVNPNGDFYLTKQERRALGDGSQRAFGASVAGGTESAHLPWCSLNFGALYCSCGVDIAGEPIFETGSGG
jgi:hypothetical protein